MVCSVNSLIGRNMASLQVGFPKFIGEAISPFSNGLHYQNLVKSHNEKSLESDLKLDGRPRVEIDRFNFADVRSHGPVNTRASNTQKYTAGKTVLAESHSWY